MSYCLKCQRQFDNDEDVVAVNSRGAPVMKLWKPLISLCPDCYASGWRLGVVEGSTIQLIQEYDEPEASLLDLLANEEGK